MRRACRTTGIFLHEKGLINNFVEAGKRLNLLYTEFHDCQELGHKQTMAPQKRVDEVVSEAEKVKAWLEEKENLQKNTPIYSPPVFTSEEVYEKVLDLQDKVSSVNRIPKPKPKVEKKTAKEEEPASKEKTTSSESAPNEGEYTETSQESKRISLHQPTLAIQNLNLMTSCEY
ncbi:unnamed protein product [Miscanthus lutarioriparius]|uniref:Uncharacterized protein n=1 Tax=Miscanthus lutarioriparius TaxID=422564 RepID=A0A811PBA7_9POAL|nr:unnamed protein product [Miscanthus lutarioriparius]